jgi:acyl dehydratase
MIQANDREKGLYLEDLHVGQRFTSGTYQISEAQIKTFAQEFDPQPFHLDEAAAQASVFAGLAASGWHTAAIAMRLLVSGGCRWAMASSVWVVSLRGPSLRALATRCA